MTDKMHPGKKHEFRQILDDKKIFVGGLHLKTAENDLRNYFERFGEVRQIKLKTDLNTGRSRGFAFVLFKQSESVKHIMQIVNHVINGKRVEVKIANVRPGKVFIGGIHIGLSDEDIKKYFERYGEIQQIEFPFDKQKNQRKAFCFITYANERSVLDVLKLPRHSIKDKHVIAKRVINKTHSRFRPIPPIYPIGFNPFKPHGYFSSFRKFDGGYYNGYRPFM
ncbi:RNA-binding protein squid-like [Aethina tumida]|uniref:RNA-binding protein squid-like n=1 Tax=Aethina tumida TaxID=116153 RepID=UPI0021483EF4|nr:RNA-binding protein squid-like [Aethina tumida]